MNYSLQNTQCFYNQINIFFGDMRVEKYTYDVRNLGQAKRAQGWRERTDIQRTDQNACVLCRERSDY